MKDSPLVTIGISVYNGASHIEQAVSSVINQTYTNWELIILDDGSKDDTVSICHSFKDKRIKFLSDGLNKGLAYRLNETVSLSKGIFYSRMDADDIMDVDRIKIQMKFLQSNPQYQVIGSSAYIIDENNRITGLRGGNNFTTQGFTSVLQNGGHMHPTVTGRIEWFQANPYDTEVVRCEDIELWLRTADNTVFGYIDQPLLFYREAGDQSIKVEKTLKGYHDMLKYRMSKIHPKYTPIISTQIKKIRAKIYVRRLLNRLGAEKYILAARSKRLSELEIKTAEYKLNRAINKKTSVAM